MYNQLIWTFVSLKIAIHTIIAYGKNCVVVCVCVTLLNPSILLNYNPWMMLSTEWLFWCSILSSVFGTCIFVCIKFFDTINLFLVSLAAVSLFLLFEMLCVEYLNLFSDMVIYFLQISQTLYKSYVENIPLFKGCSQEFINQIVS